VSTFAIEVQAVFSAAHQLRLPDGTLEPLHGHDWHVTVTVESAVLDALETVMDFHALEIELQKIIGPWKNQHLNAIPPFDRAINPSAERVAEQIALALQPHIVSPAQLTEVRITEAPGCAALWKS
jgi:6-pyruvoyltetrahydropterin/6-carboxytetrahydropterin synthase